jgi:hypothetical protein
MFRTIAVLCVLSTVAACMTAPVVSDSGSVPPLRDLAPPSGGRIVLVFVHGVGDHCRGYALDPTSGWLSTDVMPRIGLRAVSQDPPHPPINVNVFMGGEPDPRSQVEYATATYALQVPGLGREVPVRAIEITWSPLTQWIKSNQLGYDSPSTTPPPGGSPKGCTQAPDATIPPAAVPPSRLLLDRQIKEYVFDRNLADAILYSGTYGYTMERGVAEALCHALAGTPSDMRCTWPVRPVDDATLDRYFFVTHSLGSRIVYDIFLNMLGATRKGRPNPFSSELEQTAPAATRLLARTEAFYMMANQLSLLGLASVPMDARSGEVIHPIVLDDARLEALDAPSAPAASPAIPPSATVFQALGAARAHAQERLRPTDRTRLQIIAFNDTNDLLTWHIPPWYVDDGTTNHGPQVDIVNVFVQNTAKLIVIESPAPAHDRYFQNAGVWDVIACGASSGSVQKCP